jgi:saccharopine dehydrogenase-like NADP-dependent oxidoreductase
VGARVARQLLSSDAVDEVVLADPDPQRLDAVVDSLGPGAVGHSQPVDLPNAAVHILAAPAGEHVALARRSLEQGSPVVSVSDSIDDVRGLLGLDAEARERGVTVAVGAGFCPGLTCLLAAHAAAAFDQVDEVHVAKVGAGGPACAHQHHRALGGTAVDWRDGDWVERRGGSGRELAWFPDPVGSRDCYRAALPDALLLVEAFPTATRVTARVAANRRERFLAGLATLRPPRGEGGPGAVRIEVRGLLGTERGVRVYGAMDRPAVAAGAVAAVAALHLTTARAKRSGAAGLGVLLDPLDALQDLRERGIRAAVFEGSSPRTADLAG